MDHVEYMYDLLFKYDVVSLSRRRLSRPKPDRCPRFVGQVGGGILKAGVLLRDGWCQFVYHLGMECTGSVILRRSVCEV